jgi:hypothetical protein
MQQSLARPQAAGARRQRFQQQAGRLTSVRARASATAAKSVSGTMKRLKDEKK